MILHLVCVQQHRFTYNEAMPVESCTQALSDLALRFGEDDDEEGGMVSHHAHAHAHDWAPALPSHPAVHGSHIALPCDTV